jgi:hypothetical protein
LEHPRPGSTRPSGITIMIREPLQVGQKERPELNPLVVATCSTPFLGESPMAKKGTVLDPADELIVDEVGVWASQKHARVRSYIEIASATRAKYLPPPSWHAGASYIELFSGSGRSLIRGTTRIIDGSPLVAYRAAETSGAPFTAMHLNDVDPAKSAAVEKRIRALGGAPVCYSEPADAAGPDRLSAKSERTTFCLLGSIQSSAAVIRDHPEAVETEGRYAHACQRPRSAAQSG